MRLVPLALPLRPHLGELIRRHVGLVDDVGVAVRNHLMLDDAPRLKLRERSKAHDTERR